MSLVLRHKGTMLSHDSLLPTSTSRSLSEDLHSSRSACTGAWERARLHWVDVCFLSVFMHFCWIPWPFKNHYKQPHCDVFQHSWMHPIKAHGFVDVKLPRCSLTPVLDQQKLFLSTFLYLGLLSQRFFRACHWRLMQKRCSHTSCSL